MDSFIQKQGVLTEVKPFFNRNYPKVRLIFLWEFDDIKRTGRTVNVPMSKSYHRSVLCKFMKKLGLNAPIELLEGAPVFLASTLTKMISGTRCNVTLEPTGNKDYPYNIVEFEVVKDDSETILYKQVK